MNHSGPAQEWEEIGKCDVTPSTILPKRAAIASVVALRQHVHDHHHGVQQNQHAAQDLEARIGQRPVERGESGELHTPSAFIGESRGATLLGG